MQQTVTRIVNAYGTWTQGRATSRTMALHALRVTALVYHALMSSTLPSVAF